jgi:hypothetical protein
MAFMTLWTVATLGPVVLYVLVTRHLSKKIKALAYRTPESFVTEVP